MPPTDEPANPKSLQEVVDDLDRYPVEAFHFVQQGLSYTVEKVHTGLTDPNASRHISGQQLSEGLREFALLKWGMLAQRCCAGGTSTRLSISAGLFSRWSKAG